MKIQSSIGNSFIEFDDYSYDGGLYFIVKAKLENFTGENNDIAPLNVVEFVRDLDAFIMDRSLNPTLKGSDGFELSLKSYNSAGHPWVSVKVCDYGARDNEYNHEPLICLQGEFEINHEYLNAYLEYFRKYA